MKRNWDKDDNELQEEYEDLSNTWKASLAPVRRPPVFLNRRIRAQARYQLGDELKQSWLFGNLPLIWLAGCIFFAMSLYFIMSVEYMQKNPGEEESPVVTQTHGESLVVVSPSGLNGWVKFSFRVDAFGSAKDIQIIGSCLTLRRVTECDPSKEKHMDVELRQKIEMAAIENLKQQRFEQIPGRIQKLLHIKGQD